MNKTLLIFGLATLVTLGACKKEEPTPEISTEVIDETTDESTDDTTDETTDNTTDDTTDNTTDETTDNTTDDTTDETTDNTTETKAVLVKDIVLRGNDFSKSYGENTPGSNTKEQWNILTYNKDYSATDVKSIVVTLDNVEKGYSKYITVGNDGAIVLSHQAFAVDVQTINDNSVKYNYIANYKVLVTSTTGDTKEYQQVVDLEYYIPQVF